MLCKACFISFVNNFRKLLKLFILFLSEYENTLAAPAIIINA